MLTNSLYIIVGRMVHPIFHDLSLFFPLSQNIQLLANDFLIHLLTTNLTNKTRDTLCCAFPVSRQLQLHFISFTFVSFHSLMKSRLIDLLFCVLSCSAPLHTVSGGTPDLGLEALLRRS